MIPWLSHFWSGKERSQPYDAGTPLNEDREIAELASLVESGDTSKATLERLAKLLGQTDPNADKF